MVLVVVVGGAHEEESQTKALALAQAPEMVVMEHVTEDNPVVIEHASGDTRVVAMVHALWGTPVVVMVHGRPQGVSHVWIQAASAVP